MDNQFDMGIEGFVAKDLNRYAVEHKILPYLFYNAGPRFLGLLLSERGSAMCSLFDEVLDGEPNPYQPSDFQFIPRVFGDKQNSILVIQIIMPQPSDALQCRSIYLCMEAPAGERLYITSEYSLDDTCHLCAWMEDHSHFHFSSVAPEDELELVLEKFRAKEELNETVRAFRERIKDDGAGISNIAS